MVELMLLLN